jgi:glycosyltransferase involved in cell wall biosynthesis
VRLPGRPHVTIFYRTRRPPYGGSNQFLLALRGELRRRGFRVSEEIARSTRACLLHAYLVDVDRVRSRLPSGCRVVHRVDGPIAPYRGRDDGSDGRIVEINRALAHVTVVQSRYSLEAHRKLGLELRQPEIVPNAADPTLFFPGPPRPLGRPVRLIASSWSDNPGKGGETLRWLARELDPARYELTFAGRAPLDLPGARVVPPVGSHELSELLRASDIYLAPSLNDPCSNALIEALQCGLPAIYARSGGHPELVRQAGIGYDSNDEIPALLDRLIAEYDERRERIEVVSLAEVADRYLKVMGLA